MKVYHEILANGLIIVAISIPKSPLTHVSFFVEVGSLNEDFQHQGISHLIEHVKVDQISDFTKHSKLRTLGRNAYTTFDHTCYYIEVLSADSTAATKYMAKMFLTNKLSPGHFETQRQVVTAECRMYYHDDIMQATELHLKKKVFLPDLNFNPCGRRTVISNITLEQAQAFHDKYYVASNTIFVIAGAFDVQTIMPLLKSKLQSQPYVPHIPFDMKGAIANVKHRVSQQNEMQIFSHRDVNLLQVYISIFFINVDQSYSESIIKAVCGFLFSAFMNHLYSREKIHVWNINPMTMFSDAINVTYAADLKNYLSVTRDFLNFIQKLQKKLLPEDEINYLNDILDNYVKKTKIPNTNLKSISKFYGQSLLADRKFNIKKITPSHLHPVKTPAQLINIEPKFFREIMRHAFDFRYATMIIRGNIGQDTPKKF